jgi:hypothetical protein
MWIVVVFLLHGDVSRRDAKAEVSKSGASQNCRPHWGPWVMKKSASALVVLNQEQI